MISKILFCFLAMVAVFAAPCVAAGATPNWVSAVGSLISRLLPPQYTDKFILVAANTTGTGKNLNFTGMNNDFFAVNATGGVVTIRANSGVAMASGLYHYLKHATNCQVTWGVDGTGNQLSVPPVLPDFAETVVNATVPFRYAWNMCTLSYSAAFWSEARWMQEIDWLALHGINYPLAFTGQEYIWLQVFADYNVSLDQLEDWFSGPAFLAWQRAGNIQGFGGPLPMSFIVDQMNLQLKILERMRSFGMTPILPCFAGHVPQISAKIWPNANFTKSTAWDSPLPFWSNQTRVLYLDPTDALFLELGRKFLQKQAEVYGSDHYYNCDTFNEADPTSTDLQYLANASRAVHEAIVLEDPQGIWVMQAWLFHFDYWNPERVEAYLSGVPNSSMIILDLNSENGTLAPLYQQYYGKPWVWNLLHNYGGVRGMYGNLTEIATGPFASLRDEGSTMMGIGFTPEAIEQNPIVYELLTDTFWTASIDLETWLDAYVVQRYGAATGAVVGLRSAWTMLVSAVYAQPGEPRSDIEWVPTWLNCTDSCALWGNTNLYGWQFGDPGAMLEAFRLFLDAAAALPGAELNGPLLYDLVDISRQAATMFFTDLHRQLTNAGVRAFSPPTPSSLSSQSAAAAQISRVGALMTQLIMAVDDLLATNPNYLLGKWVQDALNLAEANATSLFRYNAKNQVTLWGPTGQINDYAAKAWAGLYGTYYYGRWSRLVDSMQAKASSGLPWDEQTYKDQLLQFEMAWDASDASFSSTPSGASALNASSMILALITAAGANASFAPGYVAFAPGQTIVAPNEAHIAEMWTRDVGQLSLLCALLDDCVAFDTTGRVVQLNLSALHSIPVSSSSTGSNDRVVIMFVKQQLLPNITTYGAPTDASSPPNHAAIIGGVVGGFAVVALVGALMVSRRRHAAANSHRQDEYQPLDNYGAPRESPGAK